MISPVDHPLRVWTIAAAVAVPLWLGSLLLPIADVMGAPFGGWDALRLGAEWPLRDPGSWAAQDGWMLTLPWLANAVWLATTATILFRRIPLKGSGLAALALALSTFLTLQSGMAKLGVWAWLGALAIYAAVDVLTLLTPRSPRRSGSSAGRGS